MEIRPLTEGEKTGVEARRDGARVAHMVGRLGEAPSRGRHAWVGLGDHSLAEGEDTSVLADVYAAAGAPWVADNYLTHIVEVAADERLLQLFFALGFGQEQVHATAPSRAQAPPAPSGFSVRQAGPGDIELLLDIVGTLSEYQAGPPVWTGLPVPQREDMREDWEEFLSEDGAVILVAERDGDPLGYVGGYPADAPDVLHVGVAGTRPEFRGEGIGVALVEHALHRAHEDGYATVELDWRATNLLASRFWPKRGFAPTHYRLRRDVQPHR